jgi:hypothetical protein
MSQKVPYADIAVECEDEAGQKTQRHGVTLGVQVRKASTKSISKSNRNCLGAARLVCMTEVSDLPNPVAGCRRLPRMRMLRRNAFGMWPREKSHSALD